MAKYCINWHMGRKEFIKLHQWWHVKLVQDWNQKRANLDAKVGELIADTLTLHLEDGREFVLNRDSAIAYFANEYKDYLQQSLVMNAAIPMYYSDIDHYWVYSWVNTTIERKERESYSMFFHEDYRIVNNKIREIYQFKRQPATE